jgi:hypothetical protein
MRRNEATILISSHVPLLPPIMPFMPSLIASEIRLHELPGYLTAVLLWLRSCSQSLDQPLLEATVRRQFLEHSPFERRMVVEMFREEASEVSISIWSLADLMEHLMHKMRILCAPCHKLLPRSLITQHPIHHRCINWYRSMGAGRERYP